MIKDEFIKQAGNYLCTQGFKKKKNYWYLLNEDIVYCVFVQGSQWCKNDYYVEIGIAQPSEVGVNPSLTRWHLRKRCKMSNGEDRNITLNDLIENMNLFSAIHNSKELVKYLECTPHTVIGLQLMI